MIEVKDLTMTYKNGKGVFDLSFSVEKGEVFGYLGPNGSGKTTTIRQLLGFTNADKGHCTINGLDCRTQTKEIQKLLGYLPGEIAFFSDMNDILYYRGKPVGGKTCGQWLHGIPFINTQHPLDHRNHPGPLFDVQHYCTAGTDSTVRNHS